MVGINKPKEWMPASQTEKQFINDLLAYKNPIHMPGHISNTENAVKRNNRIVFEFNSYVVCNIDGRIVYTDHPNNIS